MQCNYCKKPGHTIDKCFKLQRLRGQSDKGRRVAASVQQNDSLISSNMAPDSSTGQYTLSSEQYDQLLALLSKQQPLQVSSHLGDLASACLSGKFFCLSSANSQQQWIVEPLITLHHICISFTLILL